MSEPLAVDLSQCLVAYAGEVITCPECGRPLATFRMDAYGAPPWAVEVHEAIKSVLCRCGGRATEVHDCPDPLKGRAPRMHLSTGWRALGGE